MKSFLIYIIITINIILILSKEFHKTQNIEKELNIPKITELFNIKTHPIKDINGNSVDLSLYDRVSSIISFYGPNKEHIIIGGLGARDISQKYPYDDSYLEKNCIIRSIDGGKTWTALTPKGKTDRKVYGLSTNNKGIVIAVTGDRGHACILASLDYGLTWKVALSNKDLGNISNPLYNSYYSKSRDLFLIPIGKLTYTTKDGINFNKGEYTLPLGRNGYVFEELDQIWIASSNLYVLKKGAKKAEKVVKTDNKYTFSTINYLGNGHMVALAYGYPGGKATEFYTTSFVRKSHILYLTIPNHQLKSGMVTMDIKIDSPLYSTMQNGLEFTVVDKNTIKMNQIGVDINFSYAKILIKIFKDEDMVKPKLYRSTDYGKTWVVKSLKGATFSHGMVWSRDIINMGNGLLYMNFPGHENTPEYECAMFLKSNDYGNNWYITNDIVINKKEKINAIYRSVVDVDGSIISGAQNYGRILRIR